MESRQDIDFKKANEVVEKIMEKIDQIDIFSMKK